MIPVPLLEGKGNRGKSSLMMLLEKSSMTLSSMMMMQPSQILLENPMENFDSSVGTSDISKGVMLHFIWTHYILVFS